MYQTLKADIFSTHEYTHVYYNFAQYTGNVKLEALMPTPCFTYLNLYVKMNRKWLSEYAQAFNIECACI